MRRLSLRTKLTLLYTAMMTAVVCVILALLFSLSGKELLAGVQNRLEQEVAQAGGDIEYGDGILEFDSDMMDLEYGIYLSVYGPDGTMLYGRIPYDFDNSVPFEDGSIRRFSAADGDYYLMDLYYRVEGYGLVVIRGITSITEAEGSYLMIVRLAVILLPLAAALTAGLGYFMTGRTLRPVAQITETVRKILKDRDLSRRIGLGEGRDEIYRMAATFDQLLEQVESSLKREQQFTSDVSHELRTPVAAMLLVCEDLLERGELGTEERESVEMLYQKTRYLSQMISQLLMLSRADQGRERLVMEQVDFSELTAMAAEEAREAGREKNIRVYDRIQPGLSMEGDETLLIRLWMNLLENAVNYGKEGGHIWLSLEKEGNGIRGRIRDDGIGIRSEDLPHIWERFFQADASRTRQDSSGLGLSMVQWIVKVHHGHIQADSRYGQGTEFTFWFPAGPEGGNTEDQQKVSEESFREAGRRRKKR